MPGEILGGKYQAERIIGEGGMGLVIAARHLHLDQRVAIKLLSPEHMGQPAIVDRFLREARASVRLRSEHVARVLDAGRFDDGAPYLVMEYLEGRDLAAELADVHHLPVATAIDFVLQVCEAVAEAHQAGIIHRDLKPANMFVTRDGDGAPLIKVLDFGISKVSDDPISDLTRTKMVLGSPPYMSPEQLRASRNVDERSDVWSLGVVLYELVSGRRPFGGETLTALALQITSDAPEPLGSAGPPRLEAAIARCLAKAPAERYASVGELAAALAPFGGARDLERIERIRRRTPAATAARSSAIVIPAADQHTTLSSATGTLGSGLARARPRYLLIGGVALVVAAIAVGVSVAMWPANSSTSAPSAPATLRDVQPALPPVRSQPATPGAALLPPDATTNAAATLPAAGEQPTATAPPTAIPPPSTASAPHPTTTIPPPVAAAPASTATAPHPTAATRARPTDSRAVPKPAPGPVIHRPARPATGSAAPTEDLTKSQY